MEYAEELWSYGVKKLSQWPCRFLDVVPTFNEQKELSQWLCGFLDTLPTFNE